MALYATGTVSVTNGSTAVTGAGTAWFGSLQRGWLFLGPDGRAVGIADVVDNTTITLTRPYQGSTASAQTYECAPTMSLAGNLAVAFQGIATNFQGIIDGPGQGRFPDGTPAAPGVRFAADPDSGLRRTGANGVALVAGGSDKIRVSGNTVSGDGVQASPTDTTPGRLMKTGAFGLGEQTPPTLANIDATDTPVGFYRTTPATTGVFPRPQPNGQVIIAGYNPDSMVQVFWNLLDDVMYQRRYRLSEGGWQPWRTTLDTGSTTVDANGFIKSASPIVQLSNDGIKEPVTPVNAVFERKGTGHYTLSEVEPLATVGWQIEVPQDHNGNRLVFVKTEYDRTARVLTVKTASVAWDSAKSVWSGGAPQDIPDGRWIDVRLHAPDIEDAPVDDSNV